MNHRYVARAHSYALAKPPRQSLIVLRNQSARLGAERLLDIFAAATGRKLRPAVSNAVAQADILRCPEVVAHQAAGQKDVEADLRVRVSAA